MLIRYDGTRPPEKSIVKNTNQVQAFLNLKFGLESGYAYNAWTRIPRNVWRIVNAIVTLYESIICFGFAKTYSSVSVNDFLKRSSVGYASKDGFEKVREYAYRFATVEGFDTHGLAVKERK